MMLKTALRITLLRSPVNTGMVHGGMVDKSPNARVSTRCSTGNRVAMGKSANSVFVCREFDTR
jgi:hypothetical protein